MRSRVKKPQGSNSTPLIAAISGNAELIDESAEDELRELAQEIRYLSLRMSQEISLHRLLLQSEGSEYIARIEETSVAEVLKTLRMTCRAHPAARQKSWRLAEDDVLDSVTFHTDMTALVRVLGNMVINAFEATKSGGKISLWAESSPQAVSFCVQNSGTIPADVAQRVFQRNFSTKGSIGRGLGTYSMKLIGETVLGGRISFSSSEDRGTVFRLDLPYALDDSVSQSHHNSSFLTH